MFLTPSRPKLLADETPYIATQKTLRPALKPHIGLAVLPRTRNVLRQAKPHHTPQDAVKPFFAGSITGWTWIPKQYPAYIAPIKFMRQFYPQTENMDWQAYHDTLPISHPASPQASSPTQ